MHCNPRSERRRFSAAFFAGIVAAALPASAVAQSYPSQPIRLLVGFAAGGGADAIARTLAARLGEQLGQNVVVENRPGASSTIAADVLAKAAPDGYTLMFADSSLLIASRAMARVGFDPLTSFAPVASVAIAPLAIVVNSNSPIRSLEDMANASRNGPALLYATSGVGTVHHLAIEYLQSQAKITMTHIPYRGASQILPDLIGGQVPVAVVSAAAALGHVRAGRLRVLGLTSPNKLREASDWRSVADWLPGFDASPRLFVLAPAGTPAPVVRRLDAEIGAALAHAAVAETLSKQGAIVAAGSAEALGREMRVELQRWESLIRQANISLQ